MSCREIVYYSLGVPYQIIVFKLFPKLQLNDNIKTRKNNEAMYIGQDISVFHDRFSKLFHNYLLYCPQLIIFVVNIPRRPVVAALSVYEFHIIYI